MSTAIEIEPYIIGKTYVVPVVRGRWLDRDGDFPVMGPKHDDADYIGFEWSHYHVDARFLSAEQFDNAENRMRRRFIEFNAAFAKVITGPTGFDRCAPEPKFIGSRNMTCLREWPDYPHGLQPWRDDLEAAYASAVVSPALMCPHRGAPLKGLAVKSGCVTCPLHGLRWSVETGKLVPAPPHPSSPS